MKSTLQPILGQLIAQEKFIRGVAVIKTDGKQLISVMADNIESPENILVSTIFESLSQKINCRITEKNIENVLVCYEQGYGILSRCNYDTILLTLMKVNGVEKIPFLTIKKVSENIAEKISLTTV